MIPRLGRSPGEGKDYSVQYSGLENSMDRIVHGVAESQTRLSDLHFHFHFGNNDQVNTNNRVLAVVSKIRTISSKVWYFFPKVWHIRNGIILPKLLIIIFVVFKKIL